ncbi:MAG: hypothetical protein DBY30_08595 [Verrucomicrobia bacterium]|nr:MAG: hypothetical protein DBY30_08595 [Verrucomicrobiota bacterium]
MASIRSESISPAYAAQAKAEIAQASAIVLVPILTSFYPLKARWGNLFQIFYRRRRVPRFWRIFLQICPALMRWARQFCPELRKAYKIVAGAALQPPLGYLFNYIIIK